MVRIKNITAVCLFFASIAVSAQSLPEAPQPKHHQIIANSFNIGSTFVWAAALRSSSKACVTEGMRDTNDPRQVAQWHPRKEFIHAVEVGLAADGVVFLVSHFKPSLKDRLQWMAGSAKIGSAVTTFYDGCAGFRPVL